MEQKYNKHIFPKNNLYLAYISKPVDLRLAISSSFINLLMSLMCT